MTPSEIDGRHGGSCDDAIHEHGYVGFASQDAAEGY